MGLRAVRKGTDVGPNSHRNTSSKLFTEFLGVEIESAAVALGLGGKCGVRAKIFGDGKRGDGEDLFFAHDAHGFVAELVSVVYGSYTCARGIQRAGLTCGVDGHSFAGASCLFDGHAELCFCVLEWR